MDYYYFFFYLWFIITVIIYNGKEIYVRNKEIAMSSTFA